MGSESQKYFSKRYSMDIDTGISFVASLEGTEVK